jgi:hypothetical protein
MERGKMKIFSRIAAAVFFMLITAIPLTAQQQPGTVKSKPNPAGGFDFFDSEGNKTGFSTKRHDGGYDYFNQYGNKTGSLVKNEETGTYEYRDAEDIDRGTFTEDAYGGYRFKAKGEDTVTAEQATIRHNYEYADPYGKGIETLSSEIIRGIDTITGFGRATDTGLGTGTHIGAGVDLGASRDTGLSTSAGTRLGVDRDTGLSTSAGTSLGVDRDTGLSTSAGTRLGQ